jgi:acyl-coenzyme A synthetase/AMP-(fatty) acid ligase
LKVDLLTRRNSKTPSGEHRYTGELPPAELNLARYCLRAAAGRHPEKTALILCADPARPKDAARWSYGEIEDVVLRMAGGLAGRGLAPGERVFIRMGNSLDYALVFFAANAAGLVPVPASPMLSVHEAATIIDDCRPRAVVTDGTLALPDLPDAIGVLGPEDVSRLKREPRADYAATGCDDPAFLIYTSGTSGRPKGVLHGQRAVWGRRPMYRGWYGLRPDDVVLHTGGFNWTYTLGTGLFDPWANGATALLYCGPRDVTVWPRLARAHGATIMASVPSLYRQLLKYGAFAPGDLASVRHGLSAGEVLSPGLFHEMIERTGLTLYEALGMSEISTYVSSSPEVPPKPGSPGKPQPGRAVAILPMEGGTEPLEAGETGLLAVHGSDPGLMLGYWNRPEEERAAFRGGWFLGGDLATMDNDGYIWFEGRNDDLMNAFGYRVSPQEVENVLLGHPAVSEAGVAQVRVREDVSVIAAFVVAAGGCECDAAALLEHAGQHLARYKLPREIRVVESLPRTPNGKLLRRELATLMRQDIS